MASNPKTNTGNEINSQDAAFVFECVKNLDPDKQVDIVKVASALGYTNVASAGNRFRALRKRYGFNLDYKNSSRVKGTKTTKAVKKTKAGNDNETTDDDSSSGENVLASPVKPSKKDVARKGAKVNSKPIPATASDNLAGSKATSGKAKGKKDDPVFMDAVHVAITNEIVQVEPEEETRGRRRMA